MTCLACDGGGCRACRGKGEILIRGCPLEIAGEEAFEVVRAVEDSTRGLPPAAGGLYDQAAAFVFARRQVLAEEAYWRAKNGQ